MTSVICRLWRTKGFFLSSDFANLPPHFTLAQLDANQLDFCQRLMEGSRKEEIQFAIVDLFFRDWGGGRREKQSWNNGDFQKHFFLHSNKSNFLAASNLCRLQVVIFFFFLIYFLFVNKCRDYFVRRSCRWLLGRFRSLWSCPLFCTPTRSRQTYRGTTTVYRILAIWSFRLVIGAVRTWPVRWAATFSGPRMD